MNTTVAFAVAYALYMKVKRIDLFGIDFSYKENLHFAEAGRACVEFWISKCMENGIEVGVSGRSTLLDNNMPATHKLLVGPFEDINKKLEEQGLKINEDVVPPEPYRG